MLRRAYLLAVFTLFLGLAACATAPVQEMSDARQTIAVARNAGAEEFAAEELHLAEQYLESAQQKLNEQAYKLARDDANKAKLAAMDALVRTESAKAN